MASRGVIDLDDKHATLTFPTIYVKSVPVLWFPWIDLPLSSRRTGLLVPRPANTLQSGWAVDVPFFITLGQSYDLTLTPGMFFGAPVPAPGGMGVKGPRLLGELHYAPSRTTSGVLTLGLLDDRLPRRDPVNAGNVTDVPPVALVAPEPAPIGEPRPVAGAGAGAGG